jgi:hypothetical protein
VKRAGAASKRAKSSALVVSSRVARIPTQVKKASVEVAGARHKAARVIARNPFRVVAGALAVGFVFAKLRSFF